jgi:hypothetical protein
MIEIAVMASSLVSSFLVPLLKNGGESLRETLTKRTTESVADKLVQTAGRLWARVKGTPRPPDAQQIVDMFERQPELMREAVEKIVREQLEHDEAFRQDVDALLEAEDQPGTANWRLMGEVVGAVDARGATISGGTVAGVVYNARGKDAGA